jgi:hypothetical protein
MLTRYYRLIIDDIQIPIESLSLFSERLFCLLQAIISPGLRKNLVNSLKIELKNKLMAKAFPFFIFSPRLKPGVNNVPN